jgi:hypothetical protein
MRFGGLMVAALAAPVASAAPKGPGTGVVTLDVGDLTALAADDAFEDSVAGRWRYGVEVPLDVSPATHGRFVRHGDGSRSWRLQVRSPGAVNVDALFSELSLAPGATLTVTGAERSVTWDAARVPADGRVGSTPLRGDVLDVELFEPAGVVGRSWVALDGAVHGYRDQFRRPSYRDFGDSGSCNVDVACDDADPYREFVGSAVLVVAPGYVCSATLVANTALDLDPLFLTANHCLSRDVSRWSFWFNYERPGCGSGAEPDGDVVSGADLVANDADSDFGLLRAREQVPESYGPWWAGWDRRDTPASMGVAIHHPAGDVKKISLDTDRLTTDPSDDNFWRAQWDLGTTEGGSSGSGLYDGTGHLVGQLYGGDAACGSGGSDYYGKISASWTGGGSSDSRLRDHLDPLGTGASVLDGHGSATREVDASIAGFLSPVDGGDSCGGAPVVRLRNGGSEALRDATITLTVDGSSAGSTRWSGNLATGATEDVELDGEIGDLGEHSVTAAVDVDGDENPANDAVSIDVTVIDASGAPLPFSDAFDDGLGDVEAVGVPNDGTRWQVVDVDSNGDGQGAVAIDNFNDDTSGTSDYLRLPALDLTDARVATLSFDVAYAYYGADNEDGLRVRVTDACGGEAVIAYEAFGRDLDTAGATEDEFVPTADEWRRETVDLSDFLGQVVVIEIENVGGYGQWVYVDDVTVDGRGGGGGGGGDDEEVAACACSSTAGFGAGWAAVAVGAVAARRRRR